MCYSRNFRAENLKMKNPETNQNGKITRSINHDKGLIGVRIKINIPNPNTATVVNTTNDR